MKYVKVTGLVALAVAFIALIVALMRCVWAVTPILFLSLTQWS